MIKRFRNLLYLFIGGCCALLDGCTTTSSNIGVYLDDEIQSIYGYCPTLEVDNIGLTDVEVKRLQTYDVDKYFNPPQTFRKSLGAVTIKFSETDMNAKIIPKGSSAWDKWKDKGATAVGIITNLPMVIDKEDNAGPIDPRKLIFNLNDGGSSRSVVIKGSGVIEVKKAPKATNVVEIE